MSKTVPESEALIGLFIMIIIFICLIVVLLHGSDSVIKSKNEEIKEYKKILVKNGCAKYVIDEDGKTSFTLIVKS